MIHAQTDLLLHTQAEGTQLRDGAQDPIPPPQHCHPQNPSTGFRLCSKAAVPPGTHTSLRRGQPWRRGPPSHCASIATRAASPAALPDGDIGVGTIPATHPGILQTPLLCRVVTCSLWSTFRSLPQDLVPSPSLRSSLPCTVQEGATPCNANGQRRLRGLGTLATPFSGAPPSAPQGAGATVSWT